MAYSWANSKLHLSGYFALLFLAISGAVFQGVLFGLVNLTCLDYSIIGCFFIILIDNTSKYLKTISLHQSAILWRRKRARGMYPS
jgi:hypothetical protein